MLPCTCRPLLKNRPEFIVKLPLPDSHSTAPVTGRQGGVKETQPLRVMLVDDDASVANSMGSLVRSLGHQVQVVRRAADALDAMRQFEPELLLVDICMPGMSGFELAESIRREIGADVMLAAMTGYDDDDFHVRSLASGFDRHLTKPVSVETLEEILGNLARQPR